MQDLDTTAQLIRAKEEQAQVIQKLDLIKILKQLKVNANYVKVFDEYIFKDLILTQTKALGIPNERERAFETLKAISLVQQVLSDLLDETTKSALEENNYMLEELILSLTNQLNYK